MAKEPVTWLSRWERIGLALVLLLVVLFGALVEYRSAFLSRRMGDLGCFLRAGWAVRTGTDPYQVTFNSWHYNYPPMLAILVAPLADPPEGMATAGFVPYAVSAAVWYVLSVIALALGVHWLARALEQTSSNPAVRGLPAGCRRWWALRLWPVLACLPPVGHTLMRGQVNLFVLALFCGAAAAAIQGRRLLGGFALAVPACIKIYPAFLFAFPAWRRDSRGLAGCALGLVVCLAVVPALAFGPARTVGCYRELAQVLIGPALGAGGDQSRATELINVTATDSQSLLAVMHNTLHPEPYTRPRQAAPAVRLASYLAGGGLTLLTFWAAGWRRPQDGPAAVIFFGMLILNMLLLCPVCHLHYFCMSIPLVMGLLAARWESMIDPRLGGGLTILLAVHFVANVLGQVPALQLLRDCGAATYGALVLWTVGLGVLRRRIHTSPVAAVPPAERLGLAA